MPRSEVVKGEALDFRFVRREVDVVFYVGDIIVGLLFRTKNGKWSAVSVFKNPYGPVNGFASKLDAAEYLLSVMRKEELAKAGIPAQERLGLEEFAEMVSAKTQHEWLPIETAPKDGRKIILLDGVGGCHSVRWTSLYGQTGWFTTNGGWIASKGHGWMEFPSHVKERKLKHGLDYLFLAGRLKVLLKLLSHK